MKEERLGILKMLEDGQIGADEAATLLAALSETGTEDTPEPAPVAESQARTGESSEGATLERSRTEVPPPLPTPSVGGGRNWARFWVYPMMAGSVVLILGALVVALVYGTDAARGWQVCGWLPMLLGLTVMLLAVWSRGATWMHLRITEGGRRKIAFSFPLPLGLAAWAVRVAQPFVPQLRETGVDDLIIALRDSASRGEPFSVDVQDDEDGERVEVYIG